MSLVTLYCTKEDLKEWVVMGIIVDPVTKKLPHPQDGSFQEWYVHDYMVIAFG